MMLSLAYAQVPFRTDESTEALRPRKDRVRRTETSTTVPETEQGLNTNNCAASAAIALEYASLKWRNHTPLGMYIVPSTENAFIWDGVIFVHKGHYANAVFKFCVTFPTNYPDRQPVVKFVTDVFHPLISDDDGRLNLALRFRPWRPKEHHIFDVLHYIKACFKTHVLDEVTDSDCLNSEALRLYRESIQSFTALATQSALLSNSPSALFDTDYASIKAMDSEGMRFQKLSCADMQKWRSALGLTSWDEVIS